MKTFAHLVFTTIIVSTSAALAQEAVPPPPPGPPPPGQPPRLEPPPSIPGDPRSDRRREASPPPVQLERAPGSARGAEERRERRGPQPEQRDPYGSGGGADRRRATFFGSASGPEWPLKPTPYLGVVTATTPPVLAAQLGLKEGFGLVVNEVVPGSPAANGGLQKHDVLKLLNDQQLVDPNQFATLVRSIGKDQEVTVTLLRNGQEQKISVKLGERMLPERPAAPGNPALPPAMPTLRSRWETPDRTRSAPTGQIRAHPPELDSFRQKIRDYQGEMQRFQQRLREWQKNPTTEMPAPPPVPAMDSATGQPLGPNDLLREVRPGGAAELRIIQPDGSTTFHTNQARLMIKDGEGEIEMTNENGRRVINIRDAAGKSIYNGPVDTAEQRQAVPEPFRGKIDKMLNKNFSAPREARVEVEAAAEAGAPARPDVQ